MCEERKKVQEYLTELDVCLGKKTIEGYRSYLYMFQQTDLSHENILKCRSDKLMYAYIFAVIATEELRSGYGVAFLGNGNSLEELVTIIRQIEFRLWEVEFDCGEDAEERLYHSIQKYHITPIAMRCIIQIGGMRKKECFLFVARIYLENGQREKAQEILQCGIDYLGKDRELQQSLEQLITGEQNE